MARPRIQADAPLAQTAFRISEKDLEAIRSAANRNGQSQGEWIREAIRQHLERNENG